MVIVQQEEHHQFAISKTANEKYLKYLFSAFNSNFDSNMSRMFYLLFYSSRNQKQKDGHSSF